MALLASKARALPGMPVRRALPGLERPKQLSHPWQQRDAWQRPWYAQQTRAYRLSGRLETRKALSWRVALFFIGLALFLALIPLWLGSRRREGDSAELPSAALISKYWPTET
jgi:hypothetical protein